MDGPVPNSRSGESREQATSKSKNGAEKHVHFAILSAKNLPPPETRFCAAPGVINPFAMFSFRGVRGKTHVERRNDHPVWNMELKELGKVRKDSEETVTVMVFHRTRLHGASPLGKTTINVHRLLEAGPGNHQRWMKVPPLKNDVTEANMIQVLIKFKIESAIQSNE